MEKEMKYQLKLSLPSAFEGLISIFITLVDTIAISPLGSKYIAIVGAVASIIELIYLLTQSINLANSITIARLYGNSDIEKIKITTSTSIYISVFWTAISIIITILISPYLPKLFKIDKICLTYLFIRLIGVIPTSISTILSGHLRTLEKANTVLNIKIVILLLKISINFIVIRLNYKLIGIAITAVLLDILTLVLLYLKAKPSITFKFSKQMAKDLNHLIKYATYEKCFNRISNFILNIILSRIGTFAYAAHTILIQIIDGLDNFCHGMGIGISTNVGIALGSQNKEKIRNTKKIVDKINWYMALISPLIIFIILISILPILLQEHKSLTIAYKLIYLVIIYSILDPIRYNLSSMLKGTKDLKSIANINLISDCFLKLFIAYILCNTTLKITGAWISFNITTLTTIILLKLKLNKVKQYKN